MVSSDELKLKSLDKVVGRIKPLLNATLCNSTFFKAGNSTHFTSAEQSLDEILCYEEAYNYYRIEDCDMALHSFRRCIEKFPNSKEKYHAYFWMGECYFDKGDYGKAILNYQVFISSPGSDSMKPKALFKQAMAFRALGDTETYRSLLKELVRDYPHTDEALKAKEFLKLK